MGTVRLAELVASLSLASDLGRGQPLEQCVRKTLIATRLGDQVGLDESDRVATYYAGLLYNVYCHSDAFEQARWFSDDIAFKAAFYDVGSPTQAFLLMLRMLGRPGPGPSRARRIASFPGAGLKEAKAILRTHSTLAGRFAETIGLDQSTSNALRAGYEHWDGKGEPNRLRGEEIALPARLVTLSDMVEAHNRRGGVAKARAVARKGSGSAFDPSLVELFCDQAPELLDGLDQASSWDVVIDSEPQLARTVSGPELDDVLEALADLVDMKSPYLAGHSRGVANLATEAGRLSGLAEDDLATLRRAALVHDLGRLGVSNAIWDKAGPLTDAEMEHVRLHPYLTDRMLSPIAPLARARELAARHHERLDGSGYPAGLTGAALTPLDRLLAAADAYHAMTEPRPYRDPLDAAAAAGQLRAQAKAGRLDGEAVNSVLKAAGHRAPARRDWPAGLTAREVEVLGLLARGHTNKEIAERLVVAPKTVSNHVEHIYMKIDVSSRAAATLYATQQGLVGSFEAS